jgi:hypothetical protein
MGREAKTVKDRKCNHCEEVMPMTAQDMKDHVKDCIVLCEVETKLKECHAKIGS